MGQSCLKPCIDDCLRLQTSLKNTDNAGFNHPLSIGAAVAAPCAKLHDDRMCHILNALLGGTLCAKPPQHIPWRSFLPCSADGHLPRRGDNQGTAYTSGIPCPVYPAWLNGPSRRPLSCHDDAKVCTKVCAGVRVQQTSHPRDAVMRLRAKPPQLERNEDCSPVSPRQLRQNSKGPTSVSQSSSGPLPIWQLGSPMCCPAGSQAMCNCDTRRPMFCLCAGRVWCSAPSCTGAPPRPAPYPGPTCRGIDRRRTICLHRVRSNQTARMQASPGLPRITNSHMEHTSLAGSPRAG